MPKIDEIREAQADLEWLAYHGALAGVAEIARERRRQIEKLGYSNADDDKNIHAEMLYWAAMRPLEAIGRILAGVAGPEDTGEACREAGALLAAETDRLNRMLTPETP